LIHVVESCSADIDAPLFLPHTTHTTHNNFWRHSLYRGRARARLLSPSISGFFVICQPVPAPIQTETSGKTGPRKSKAARTSLSSSSSSLKGWVWWKIARGAGCTVDLVSSSGGLGSELSNLFLLRDGIRNGLNRVVHCAPRLCRVAHWGPLSSMLWSCSVLRCCSCGTCC